MAQFVGILGLLLSETSILPFNMTRYATVLNQITDKIERNNTRFRMNEIFLFFFFKQNIILVILREAINDLDKAAKDFDIRSKSLNIEKLVMII
jgi:hypothetical protein